MQISILLPYKENFSPLYPGAVSLFINSMNKLSIYKNEITVYGSTDLKEKFLCRPLQHSVDTKPTASARPLRTRPGDAGVVRA